MPENIIVHVKEFDIEMFYQGSQTWSMMIRDDQDKLVGEAITLGEGLPVIPIAWDAPVGDMGEPEEDEEEEPPERMWCEYHKLYHWPCF